MHNDHDLVDSALRSMKSRQWTGETYNPQLEEKLMQEFTKNPNGRRFAKVPAWVLAVAGVLLVGGAATGTVALVRSWLVTVQIGDKQYQFQTDDNGTGNLTVETDDGRTANIQVQRTEGDNGAHEMNVNVNVEGDNTQQQQVMKVVTRQGPATGGDDSASDADLAGTQPSAQWSTSDGASKALHIVPVGDDGGNRLFVVTTTSDGTRTIRRLAELPAQVRIAGLTPDVTTSSDGTLTLTFSNDQGKKQVLKFRDRSVSSANGQLPADSPIQMDNENGRIHINANPPSDQD